MTEKMQWWGYVHTQGTLQAKRYFDQGDIDEARSSPFCAQVFGPFPASGRDEALSTVQKLAGEMKK